MSLTTSASKLKTYAMCPKLYHWQYNLKLLSPQSNAMAIGTKYHDMVEKFHNGEPLEIGEENKEVLTRLIEKYKKNPVEGTVVDTEKRFDITIGDITVTGILDRLDTDKIVEYKTSSFDYEDKHVKNWQTLIYLWYIKKTTGQNMPMVYSVVNKTKAKTIKYIPQKIVVRLKDEEIDDVENKLISTCKEIDDGLFNKTPGEHCSYCPFGSGFSGTRNCEYGKYIGKKSL